MSDRAIALIETLNRLGAAHCDFAAAMFLQVGILVAALALLDLALLRRLRAGVRYGVWCLVLVKLLLPVWLQGPLSLTGALDAVPSGEAKGLANFPITAAPEARLPLTPWTLPPGLERPHGTAADAAPPALPQAPPVAQASALDLMGQISWQAWLLLGWLAVVASLLLLFAWRMLQVARLTRAASAAPDALQSALEQSQRLLGLERQSVCLRISDQLSTPAICGFWRATILFPRALVGKLDDEQMRLVLVHELTHWKRFDLQVNCLQTLLQIVYFYNPLVWIVNLALRRLREQAVDEAVLATMRSSIQRYSVTLLDIVAHSRPSPELALRLIGVVESRKALAGRIRRILGQPIPRRARLGFSGLATVLLIGVALLPLAGRRAAAVANDEDAPAAKADAKEDTPAAPTKPGEDEQEVAEDEIAGVVLDESGKPLADVTVDAWHWHPGNETKTDDQGRFRLKGFDPKHKVEVLITKEGYSPQHFPQRPTGVKDWVVRLNQKTYFEGKVVDPEGKPVGEALIRATFGPVEGDGVVISDVPTEGKSRPDGTYRLYVAPRTYDLQISAGERGVYRQSNVVIGANQAKRLDVQLQKGVRFEANVVDSVSGAPVEGFILWQWRGPRRVGRSDEQGRIVFDGLIPGKTEFNCGGGEEIVHESGVRFYQHGPFGRWWSPDATSEWQRFHIDDTRDGWQRNFDDLSFDLAVGMKPVTIVVEKGVTVTGRVSDPNGKPVAGATVAPARTGSGNSLTGDTRYSVETDQDGKYHVVLPASGKVVYNLVAHDGKYRQWRNWANGVSEPMQTTPGQVIEGFDLKLTQPAVVRGRVTMGGRGVGRKDVRAHAFDKLENRYYDPTTQTKEDGTFELKFVRPGKHYIQVEPFWLSAEQAPNGSKVIEVKAGEVVEDVSLEAAPDPDQAQSAAPLSFHARVISRGQPVAEASVGLGAFGGVARYFGAAGKQLGTVYSDTRTNEEGKAPLRTEALPHLRLTSSLIYAVDPASHQAGVAMLNLADYAVAHPPEAPLVIDVMLEPATLVKIDVDAGQFKDLAVKVSSITLAVFKDSSGLQHSELDAPGSWKLLLPPGTYRVSASAPGLADPVEAEFKLEADQRAHEVKLELPPSRLARLIGQPAPEFQQIKPSGANKPLRLAELKGKVVVLDFWGHWCGPCVRAMPKLMELYDEFHDRGVAFIALHDDSVGSVEELAPILARLKDQHWDGRELPFPVLLDGGGVTPIPGSKLSARGATTAAYGITAFPTTLVLDRQGRVHGQIHAHDIDAARQALNDLLR